MTDAYAPAIRCPVTDAADWERVATFDAPPPVETDFGLAPYHRELWRSRSTGHVVNRHQMDLSALYQGDYWTRTYGDDAAVRRVFDRIMDLPPERSDNRGRVAFVDGFCRERARWAAEEEGRSLLDVGSGLAVFPAAMRAAGWRAAALDPDPRAARHAETVAGVEGIVADFMSEDLSQRYSLVAFNKVLEHVPDPVAMLARAHAVLAPHGLVYVELPDAEGALEDPEGPAREEFAIEHYCAFSAASYALLAQRSGFKVELLERLVEPSGKYTLRGFLSRPGDAPRPGRCGEAHS
ncbi:MAG: class I SAM-dependent methyltransferase [Marivibrio sp.]|uniref:class I SAM-dependent methyltransferase n=1 Tax=Marivibrio sp. TaxID=2039719 RepID=UPI0032EE7A43